MDTGCQDCKNQIVGRNLVKTGKCQIDPAGASTERAVKCAAGMERGVCKS